MNAYYTLCLLGFLVLLAILLVRYVNVSVDKEFRSLARAVADEDYRRLEIARADEALAGKVPLPAGVPPLAGRSSGGRGALPPVLLALGVILLWGAGSAREADRAIWFYGGLGALGFGLLVMLLTLGRRKWARTARMLLFRADLKRLDGDRAGAAADLRELLKLTPWDDSAWAELSDDLAAGGCLGEALEAIREAARIDPRYDEYRMLEASLAIRMGRLEDAGEAIGGWIAMDGVDDQDPRLTIYRAALDLAAGDREKAAETIRKALLDRDAEDMEFLDTDQALSGVKALLPGRG